MKRVAHSSPIVCDEKNTHSIHIDFQTHGASSDHPSASLKPVMFPKTRDRGGVTCMKGGGNGFEPRVGGADPWRLEEIHAPDHKETKAERENRQRLADAASARKQKIEKEEQEEKARTRAARYHHARPIIQLKSTYLFQ